MVFPDCTVGSLYSLSLTCRPIKNEVTLRLKFAIVDLSAHHNSHTVKGRRDETRRYYQIDLLPLQFNVQHLARRQNEFLDCLFRNPLSGHTSENLPGPLTPIEYQTASCFAPRIWTQEYGRHSSSSPGSQSLMLDANQRTWSQPPYVLFPRACSLW